MLFNQKCLTFIFNSFVFCWCSGYCTLPHFWFLKSHFIHKWVVWGLCHITDVVLSFFVTFWMNSWSKFGRLNSSVLVFSIFAHNCCYTKSFLLIDDGHFVYCVVFWEHLSDFMLSDRICSKILISINDHKIFAKCFIINLSDFRRILGKYSGQFIVL